MTKTELVNSMIKLGFDFEETEDFLKFENADGNSMSIAKCVDNTDVRGKMLSLVGAYLQTPIDAMKEPVEEK